MGILSALLWIYGIGAMFTICGAMYDLSWLIAEKGFSRIMITKIPLAILTVLTMTVIWPWMLFKEPSFRKCAIETGRIAIIVGYIASAIFTMIYPWVWAWYIGGVVAWKLLERYHEKFLLKINLVQARE